MADPDDRKHFLTCFPARPIRIEPGRTYSIGRADGNNIIVADADVSRNHAAICWDDGAFVILDIGSRNGSFVNRERIDEHVLQDNDRIKMGDRVFTYRVETEEAIERLYEESQEEGVTGETEALHVEAIGAPQQGFAGSLEDFGMPELIQTLELNGKTGVLTIVGERERGTISVRSGEVVAATLGDRKGQDAVFGLLAFGNGYFEFETKTVDMEREIRLPTAQLLMEALRRQDEKKRSPRTAAD